LLDLQETLKLSITDNAAQPHYILTVLFFKGIMITTQIGENAGLIWNALQGGALTMKALKKATKLKNDDLNLALGWLAREGKLAFEAGEELIITLL
jgi:hypothetical protein